MDKLITEGSRIIAEFMGAVWDYQPEIYRTYGYRFPDGNYPTKHASRWWDLQGLQYHESWDWQIPVWNKAANNYSLEGYSDYYIAIDENDPLKGFHILVQMITEINQK